MAKNKYRNWTESEVDRLVESYGSMPVEKLAKSFDRAVGTIYYILRKEEVPLQQEWWSKEDIDSLKCLYASISNQELSKKLNRSVDAIQLKAASFDLTKDSFWTSTEDEILASMKHAGLSYNAMSDELDRTKSSIQNRLRSLGLTKDIKRWSREEVDLIDHFLTERPGELTYFDLAILVHDSPDKVRALCYYRGWTKRVKFVSSLGEEKLHGLLRELFPIAKIERQFSIGERLRLDFLVLDNNTGWEFDGQQHFEENSFFDQNDGSFSHRRILDERKEELCKLQGISLIRIRYDEPLTLEFLREKLQEIEVTDEHQAYLRQTKPKQETKSKDSPADRARARRRETYKLAKAERDDSPAGRERKEREREWRRARRAQQKEWKKSVTSTREKNKNA